MALLEGMTRVTGRFEQSVGDTQSKEEWRGWSGKIIEGKHDSLKKLVISGNSKLLEFVS